MRGSLRAGLQKTVAFKPFSGIWAQTCWTDIMKQVLTHLRVLLQLVVTMMARYIFWWNIINQNIRLGVWKHQRRRSQQATYAYRIMVKPPISTAVELLRKFVWSTPGINDSVMVPINSILVCSVVVYWRVNRNTQVHHEYAKTKHKTKQQNKSSTGITGSHIIRSHYITLHYITLSETTRQSQTVQMTNIDCTLTPKTSSPRLTNTAER